MKKQQIEKTKGVTEEELYAFDDMIDGVLSTWEPGNDEREDEQIRLVLSLSDKLGDQVLE